MSSVVRERDDGSQCWCQILFDSGERVLISIAGKPTPSVKVLRLALAGLIPVKTIWELTPAKAGGDDAFVHYFMKMFLADQNETPVRWKQSATLFYTAPRLMTPTDSFQSANLSSIGEINLWKRLVG